MQLLWPVWQLQTSQGVEVFRENSMPWAFEYLLSEPIQGPKTKGQLREQFMKKRGRAVPSAPDLKVVCFVALLHRWVEVSPVQNRKG